jgi:hypothetical protein
MSLHNAMSAKIFILCMRTLMQISPLGFNIVIQRAIEAYLGNIGTDRETTTGAVIADLLCRCSGVFQSDFARSFHQNKSDFAKTCSQLNAGMVCTTCRSDLKEFAASLPDSTKELNGKSLSEWLEDIHICLEKINNSTEFAESRFEITKFDLDLIKIKLLNYRGHMKRKELMEALQLNINQSLGTSFRVSVFF